MRGKRTKQKAEYHCSRAPRSILDMFHGGQATPTVGDQKHNFDKSSEIHWEIAKTKQGTDGWSDSNPPPIHIRVMKSRKTTDVVNVALIPIMLSADKQFRSYQQLNGTILINKYKMLNSCKNFNIKEITIGEGGYSC
jgi:hypothetical protein